MHLLLRNGDQSVDSIWYKYKVDKKYFYIYTHAFLASKNKILSLTSDSFIYVDQKIKTHLGLPNLGDATTANKTFCAIGA
jgi:hypothetical protein